MRLNWLKKMVAAVLLISTIACMGSCRQTDMPESPTKETEWDTVFSGVTTEEPPESANIRISGVGIDQYTIVYPKASSEELLARIRSFRDAVSWKTGVQLKLTDDTSPQTNYEILVGNTDRQESQSANQSLRLRDFYVGVQNGKLILASPGDEGCMLALNSLEERIGASEQMLSLDSAINGSTLYPYALQEITVVGKPLFEYVIVAETADNYAASIFRDSLEKLYGYRLDIFGNQELGNHAYEIVFGSSRSSRFRQLAADAELTDSQYMICTYGAKIYMGVSENCFTASDTSAAVGFLKEVLGVDSGTGTAAQPIVKVGNISVKKEFDTMMIQQATKELFDLIDKKQEELTDAILNSANLNPLTGKVFYVSNSGNDNNDGLTPQTAWATIGKVNRSTLLLSGGTVLFERGSTWRGETLSAMPGVTYSAYGEGAKPRLFGSPYDAANFGVWEKTDTPNVYRYNQQVQKDIGGMAMDNGAYYGIKIVAKWDGSACINYKTKKAFSSYRDLKNDLEFYHCFAKGQMSVTTADSGYIYLYSAYGNPSERFSNIEFFPNMNGVEVKAGTSSAEVHVDNLCIQYVGRHAICGGNLNILTVTNCEIAWIGGSIRSYTAGNPSRLGNGVEIYGGCNRYIVDHCKFYQIYDAAMTVQYSTSGAFTLMKDVTFSNNLVEYCTWPVEIWLYGSGEFRNFDISGNIFRHTGEGFCTDRYNPVYNVFMVGTLNNFKTRTFTISNNIFDRSPGALFPVSRKQEVWCGDHKDNIVIQSRNGVIGGRSETDGSTVYPYEAKYLEHPSIINNMYYYVE